MSIIINIKVIPSSGRAGFFLDKAKKIKCYLKNPPEKGKANRELINIISKRLGLQKDKVLILSGLKNRNKKIKVETELSLDELLSELGIELQLNISR